MDGAPGTRRPTRAQRRVAVSLSTQSFEHSCRIDAIAVKESSMSALCLLFPVIAARPASWPGACIRYAGSEPARFRDAEVGQYEPAGPTRLSIKLAIFAFDRLESSCPLLPMLSRRPSASRTSA